jgi:hypothetical protein
MKKISVLLATLFVFVFALALAQPAQALPDNPVSMNARMMHWQEKAEVIHLLAFQDAGRFGFPAVVDAGQPLLFGFEWGIDPLEDLQANIIDNPYHIFTVSVDNGDPIDIKGYYQAPFVSATKSGPAWTWDHDGDGPGDGDGDGIGDWNTTILFFRYPHPGLAPGMHYFDFTVTDPADPTNSTFFYDTITVEVLP